MKTLNTTFFYFLSIITFFSSCSTSNNKSNQSNNYTPVSTGLYDTIIQMDSILFNAFNTRDFNKLETFFSEDLEFYHDLGGVTNYKQNLDAFKKTFESDRKVRREVVVASLEVYPIKDYGSVEIGIHRFYVTEKGQKEKLGSEAKFVHIWQKKDSEWKITRVISYGHKEYQIHENASSQHHKFYWGGIADIKVLASNLALNVPTRNRFEIPNKTYM